MASRLFRSPAEWALPLLVAAIETAAAAPIVALFAAFLDDGDVVADIFIPAIGLVGLIAFFSTRLLARKALGDNERALAALEPVIAATADACLAATLDDLGSATFRADLAGMQHETQYTRLFRS